MRGNDCLFFRAFLRQRKDLVSERHSHRRLQLKRLQTSARPPLKPPTHTHAGGKDWCESWHN